MMNPKLAEKYALPKNEDYIEKEGYIKKEDRKKILLITDDIRVHSGVAQIGRETVIHTCHRYNWVQIAGAVDHPEEGKQVIMDNDIAKESEVLDASCSLYPAKAYGNMDMLRVIMKREKPDAIMLITDPRYFTWLFNSEDEIRNSIPIIYLNIWDNYPAPMYNKEFYESCDALLGISKQTVNINKLVLGDKGKDKIFKYVPHGLNNNMFGILEDNDHELLEFKKALQLPTDLNFHLLFNSRNIRRKCIPDTIMAWKLFMDRLPKEEADKCILTLKTEAVFEPGTDLPAVIEYFGVNNVRILDHKLSTKEMNMLYNSADGVVLLSNAEGWGLALTEAMLTGTPFIASVTGGMQDQMRFEDEDGKWIEFNSEIPSNHHGRYKKHGEWALPVYIKSSSIVGSPSTPYIYDDHIDPKEASERMMELYKMGKEERSRIGKLGMEWALGDEAGFTSEKMSNKIIESTDLLFKTWKPRNKYVFLKDTEYVKRVLPHKLIY
jgi:glycosyltransferase involved in cell wall biosynthesis